MNVIQPTITPGENGPHVSNLQDALLFLIEHGVYRILLPPDRPSAEDLASLKQTLRAEQSTDQFGGATMQLVSLFQRQQSLGDHLKGVVEPTTATRLNELLNELGAFVTDAYVVNGRVVDEQGRALAGLELTLFDEDVTGAEQLGQSTTTGADGHYTFTFSRDEYLKGDIGHVAQPDGSAWTHLLTAAFEPTAPIVVPSGPDLWVGLGRDQKSPLARTDIVFNAGQHTLMPDLVVPRRVMSAGLSDLERVSGLVMPRLKGLLLSKLSEAQIDFLSRDCEEPVALIRALVIGARSDEEAGTLAESFGLSKPSGLKLGVVALQYALAVEDGTSNFQRLLALGDADIVHTIKDGIARARIPSRTEEETEILLPWLGELRALDRLSPRGVMMPASPGQVLATMPDGLRLKDAALRGVAKAIDHWATDPAQFISSVRDAGLKDPQIHAVVRTLSLSDLTGAHLSLIGLLQVVEPGPEHAALSDLAKLGRKEWTAFVTKAGLPPGKGDGSAATNTYVTMLMRGMEQRAPTAFVASRMADGRIQVNPELQESMTRFFTNNPDFRFGSDSVLVRFGNDNATEGIEDDRAQPLLQELLKVERIARVTPNLEAVEQVLAGGYNSALEITHAREAEFVERMKGRLAGGEGEAVQIHERARSVAETAFAIALAASPRFNREGEIQLLSGTPSTTPQATDAGAAAMTTGTLTAAQKAQTANVEALFGSQDTCACEPCSAMGSPAHYLAELLMLLDRSGRNAAQESPLDVLLKRRPDIAEIELDCDNTGHVMPYVDLVLELLETPFIEGAAMNVIPRADAIDAALDSGTVPAGLVEDFRVRVGIDLGVDAKATKLYTQPPGRWLVRGNGWRLLIRYSTPHAYRFRIFPQSGRAVMPESWSFPTQLLDYAYAPLAVARHPWSLPFHLAHEETDLWLHQLGSSLASVVEICAGTDVLTSLHAAGVAIGMTRAELHILTQSGTAATSPWRDWGYANSQESSVDWYLHLRTVSTLKQRAGISHGDLLTLIQCRFIQTSPGIGSTARLRLTGAECDSDKMLLGDPQPGGAAALQPAALRRIHLFIRLCRRLGWSMLDLDRALHDTRTVPTTGASSGTSSDEVFTQAFVIHLANVVRLCQQTNLSAEMAIALFKPSLDTYTYWRQEGSRAVAIPSTFDRLYGNPDLSRPRTPEFELSAARDMLVRSPVMGQMPQLRLSDHVSVIAAATGCTASDVLALLPRGESSIPPTQLGDTAAEGTAIDVPVDGDISLEFVVGALPSNSTFEIRFQAPSDNGTFVDEPAGHFRLGGNVITLPIVLSTPATDSWQLRRYSYEPSAGLRRKRLRVTVRRTAGTGSVWLSARVVSESGLVPDELTLPNLSLLTRHLLFTRACKLDGGAYRTLIEISAAQPLSTSAAALDFLDQVRCMRGLGQSAATLDELLRERFADAGSGRRIRAEVCETLEALRVSLASDEAELTVTPGKAEDSLRKALLEAGWPQRLIDQVVSAELLNPTFQTEHTAKLPDFPPDLRAMLKSGLLYDKSATILQWKAPVLNSLQELERAGSELKEVVRLRGDGALLGRVERALQELVTSVSVVEDVVRQAADRLFALAHSFDLIVFESAIDPTKADEIRALSIPEAWSDSLWFDAGRLRLCFKGPMNEEWRGELRRFGSSGAYLAAIDDLYTKALAFRAPAAKSIFSPPSPDAAYQLLTSLRGGMEQGARALLDRILPILRVRRAAQRVATVLEPRLGLPTPVSQALIHGYRQQAGGAVMPLVGEGIDAGLLLAADFTRSAANIRITPEGFATQYTAVRRLYKLASIASASKLDGTEVTWLLGGWPGAQAMGLGALPTTSQAGPATAWSAWKEWTMIMVARQQLGGASGVLNGCTDALSKGEPLAATSRRIAAWAGVPVDEMSTLLNGLGVQTVTLLQTPARVRQLVACLDWMRKTGCDTASLIAWGTREPDMAGAARARQFARAKMGEAAWFEASRQPLDTLRIKRRDALVSEAVHRLDLRDANDLFALLLVDPEMGPCMKTTRIRLAISSMQLFVQRILMGLEQQVSPGAIAAREWAWMQHYRMWEANLKVLLNSENYIDMSLRRDKTPPYLAVEKDLMQGDVSAARATAAIEDYLSELGQVSDLQTVGMYRDTPRDANGGPIWAREVLYFVGTTRTQPRQHYLRRFIKYGFAPDEGHWTPWERIDLDLQDTGLVSPIAHDGELSLYWLNFREEANMALPANSQTGSLPNKHWVTSLRWSTMRGGKWSPARTLNLDSNSPIIVATTHHKQMNIPDRQMRFLRELSVWRASHTSICLTQPWDGEAGRDLLEISITPQAATFQSGVKVPDPIVGSIGYPPILLRHADSDEFTGTYSLTLGTPQTPSGVVLFRPKDALSVRFAYSHQDVAGVPKFIAPWPDRDDLTEPGPFVLDTGDGEVLAQPRWIRLRFIDVLIDKRNVSGAVPLVGPNLTLATIYHPQINDFLSRLRSKGVIELLSIGTQKITATDWFTPLNPDPLTIRPNDRPNFAVDLTSSGAYSAYNAELFFMIPFALASELSKQQRFREAREWFHYVFNPTTTATTPSTGPGRYWNYLPFQQQQGTASIQGLVRKVADPADQSQEKRDFLAAIAQWRTDPFDPHRVARMRPVSYQMAVVIAYIKNLIAWGDQLFRRDTMESLNEAAQLYILAAQILGQRGETVSPRTRPLPKAFSELQADIARSGKDGLTNPLVAAESILPVNSNGSGNQSSGNLPRTLYFCVPANPAFNELRHTVQDRLFKMRNCMNIDGVVRQLALFEPPIDPAALVRARAAGIDVAALLSDVAAPPPIYRFSILAQKASEVCSEVKSLGAALLSAIEKSDGEALARLRSGHELQVLTNVRQMKELQIEEAKANIEALGPSLEGAQARLAYYVGLVSQVENLAIPTGPAGPTVKSLASAALRTVTSTLSVVQVVSGPVLAASAALLKQALTRATEAVEGAGPIDAPTTAKVPMNTAEKRQLEEMQAARESQNKANDLRLVAQLFAKIPDFTLGASGIASPVVTAQIGGSLLSTVANFMASMEESRGAEHSHRATLNSMLASYQRRAAEWTQQAKNTLVEIEQITAQVKAATIRAAITDQDLRNHDEQIENAKEVDEFLHSKWSNQELYGWMSQQISSVYFRSYQLAYDLAKRAERAYRHELGTESSEFVHFGHWDGLKKGLLSGELLYHDIKRMEAAYLEANARELEITRSISLRQLDAAALMDLRIHGQCGFELPEWLFNMDYPDHYMRRIKSVSVSLPCVVGPYTGISGKLTMLSGRVRSSATPGVGYPDDANFRTSHLASSSIAVSSAQGDSGLFEFSLRDERFLPFEGSGLVDSHWRFELPQHLRQFDYETISDLVLTIRYTARSSSTLRQPAMDALSSHLTGSPPGALLIDIKRDFPTEWARTQASGVSGTTTFKFRIEKAHFPYAYARRGITLSTSDHQAWTRSLEIGSWTITHLTPTITPIEDSWDVTVAIPQGAKSLDEVLLSLPYSVK